MPDNTHHRDGPTDQQIIHSSSQSNANQFLTFWERNCIANSLVSFDLIRLLLLATSPRVRPRNGRHWDQDILKIVFPIGKVKTKFFPSAVCIEAVVIKSVCWCVEIKMPSNCSFGGGCCCFWSPAGHHWHPKRSWRILLFQTNRSTKTRARIGRDKEDPIYSTLITSSGC